jgi:hypothetical protein
MAAGYVRLMASNESLLAFDSAGIPTLNTSLFPVQPVGVHGVRLPVRGRRQ